MTQGLGTDAGRVAWQRVAARRAGATAARSRTGVPENAATGGAEVAASKSTAAEAMKAAREVEIMVMVVLMFACARVPF